MERPDIDMEKLSRLGRQNKESEKVARRRKSLVLKFGARNKVSSLSSVGLNGHAKSISPAGSEWADTACHTGRFARGNRQFLTGRWAARSVQSTQKGEGVGKGVRRRSVGQSGTKYGSRSMYGRLMRMHLASRELRKDEHNKFESRFSSNHLLIYLHY
ncbi:hypothetical protein HDU90_001692 [Geranomyces variabilis]|nr:hypothetical protein HDU90_001692 [Geranomyces variabilis]